MAHAAQIILLIAAFVFGTGSAWASDLDRNEALQEVFGCNYFVLRRELSPIDRERLVKLGGRSDVQSVTRYRSSCADPKDRRSAYIVTRNVRTMPQTLLVVVSNDSTVEKVEVLSFQEPAEYKGRERWYKAFEDRALDEDLNVQRAIPLMAGASLTSRSTTQIVREVLAVHTVLVGR